MPSLPNHGAALHSCSCPSREDAESSADSSSSKAVADREYFFDFKLEDKPELEAVNAFATCLTGMVDLSSEVFYELTRTSAGFQPGAASPMRVSLPDPQVMPNQKRAKRSAAEKFKTDPLEQSRRLPTGKKRTKSL
ncbi:unnamed protein product [Symbiodinium sp. KB8]|nr:unnamed protein product [Symbiodinium sp. KB8]